MNFHSEFACACDETCVQPYSQVTTVSTPYVTELDSHDIRYSKLTSIQLAAIDLYNRGLNPFPVCSPEVVSNLSRMYPGIYKPYEKRPYILKPLFYSRMHMCNTPCKEREIRTGRSCPGNSNGAGFIELFDFSSMAVLLGRTSGNLVCLDCDDMKAFELAIELFIKYCIDPWAYYTSRGGNILFRLDEGEAMNSNKCNINEAQIWGNKHFCILPPSNHPSGKHYKWVDGMDPMANFPPSQPPPRLSKKQLEWLGIRLKSKSNEDHCDLFNLPEWTRNLSANNRHILISKIEEGERNSKLTKVVYDVAACIDRNLVSQKDAEQLLFWTASRCLPPYPISEVGQMLRSALRKDNLQPSKEYYDRKESSSIENLVQIASQFLNAHNWRSQGRTASTDRAVFEACIRRAKKDRSDTFRASSREIAELANIQKPITVLRSLKRLVEKGLLIKGRVDNSGANTYSFGDIVTVQDWNTNTPLNTSVPICNSDIPISFSPSTSIEQDIFLKLGRIAYPVWEHLKQCPEPGATAISKKLNLSRSSVYRVFVRLQENQLIDFSASEGLYVGNCLSENELVILAQNLGVLGKSENRSEWFSTEREFLVNFEIRKAKDRIHRMLLSGKEISQCYQIQN